MSHSCEPSRMVRFWLSIFWRALWSMRASCIRSSSRILRTSRRMVLRSSMNSTSSISARASATTWASWLILSWLNLTARSSSKHSLVFLYQLSLHLAEHFLVVGAGLLHFFLVRLQDHAHLIVDAVLQGQLFQHGGVDLLGHRGHGLGLDHAGGQHFLGDLTGQITHIFFGEEHVGSVNQKFNIRVLSSQFSVLSQDPET